MTIKYFVLTLVTSEFIINALSQNIEYYQSKHEGIHIKKYLRQPLSYDHTRKAYDDQTNNTNRHQHKRSADPVFHGHPKTREDLWNIHFLNKKTAFDQTPSLIALLHNITLRYFNDCTPLVLYDRTIENSNGLIQNLLKNYPLTYFHGRINDDNTLVTPEMLVPINTCLNFIVFLNDVMSCGEVIGLQATSKVVVIASSSQWTVHEFLQGEMSRKFVNLLVIAQTFKDEDDTLEAPYILYTHKLYIDGLGTSKPIVLTSWNRGRYTRPEVNLFPQKMTAGYAGHRFTLAAANQPPYAVRRIKTDLDGGNPTVVWDGIEVRILKFLGEKNNFSIEVLEPADLSLGSGDAVAKEITSGRADIGIGGLYVTANRTTAMDMTFTHSQDCAVFISLTSTALPRYRAIMGPFHWHVWLAMTFTYLMAIFPLAFSDKHTLRHLIHNSGEIENMFWYVFGTFTNCFTFVGKNSWSKSDKVTTRLLVGWYWIFTIIITSCYTGSIIAFVTLPIYPSTVDTVQELLKGFYRIGTLDRGGWERWFSNSTDPGTTKLLQRLELVPDVISGIRNTTKAFFWPYAFLGSRAQLEYIIQANFSETKSKRNILHISNECFVPFGVAMALPNQSLHTAMLSRDIARMVQSGLVKKIEDDVRWELQRTPTGKLLAAGAGKLKATLTEDKGLTMDDTQGMFLLLAAGFLMAAAALLSEWMGGCTRHCKFRKWKRPSTKGSEKQLIPTPADDSTDDVIVHAISEDSVVSTVLSSRRNSSAKSQNTLNGQMIYVTRDDVVIHHSIDVLGSASRRPSAVDLDREVKEIFQRADKARLVRSDSDSDIVCERRTASKGVFGDHV